MRSWFTTGNPAIHQVSQRICGCGALPETGKGMESSDIMAYQPGNKYQLYLKNKTTIIEIYPTWAENPV